MKKFYIGVKGLIHDKKRGFILLGKDYKTGDKWNLPGGRVDDFDGFAETLEREIVEELPGTTNIKIGELVGASRLSIDVEEDTSLALLYYLVDADLPEEIVLSDEHTGHIFVNDIQNMPAGTPQDIERILKMISS